MKKNQILAILGIIVGMLCGASAGGSLIIFFELYTREFEKNVLIIWIVVQIIIHLIIILDISYFVTYSKNKYRFAAFMAGFYLMFMLSFTVILLIS